MTVSRRVRIAKDRYAVYRGGQRFVVPAVEAGEQSVQVILNWLGPVTP